MDWTRVGIWSIADARAVEILLEVLDGNCLHIKITLKGKDQHGTLACHGSELQPEPSIEMFATIGAEVSACGASDLTGGAKWVFERIVRDERLTCAGSSVRIEMRHSPMHAMIFPFSSFVAGSPGYGFPSSMWLW